MEICAKKHCVCVCVCVSKERQKFTLPICIRQSLLQQHNDLWCMWALICLHVCSICLWPCFEMGDTAHQVCAWDPHAHTNAPTHMHTQRVATNTSIQMLGQAVHSRSVLALYNSAWYQHRLAAARWGNTLLKSRCRGIVITHWPSHPQTYTKAKGQDANMWPE